MCPGAREEQYRALWNEIEMLAELHSVNSENHRILYDFILQVLSHTSSAAQPSRKLPAVKTGQCLIADRLRMPCHLICSTTVDRKISNHLLKRHFIVVVYIT